MKGGRFTGHRFASPSGIGYTGWQGSARGVRVIRFVTSVFGALFTMVTLGLLFAALVIGAVFYMYGRDLPSPQSLANYTPPTISRIYSGEGALMDEFAKEGERRVFAPIEEIPQLVQDAFVSAEDKNFWTHKGYDARGIVADRWFRPRHRWRQVQPSRK